MKLTKGTIIRTIMLILVIVNLILKRTGRPVLDIQEGTVASFVETVIELGTIIIAWWENNSFTQNARKADDYLKKLNTTN
ncbi:phage holin [Lachnoclostridium phytofermentans]|uniref:Holin, SPP1 family n=1 Tax=Lachnoclostridium phytofermentans (strain ATCC 700394 / DSM 18823 / ISDg) TaxID=357809 RepID=A9KMI2_LACP7|nr:phage holin [Lachnoclostridium phytofermentans]ABX41427.1 holin, SPP1 family [Lachnoclostridium phytofermentans ISDg]